MAGHSSDDVEEPNRGGGKRSRATTTVPHHHGIDEKAVPDEEGAAMEMEDEPSSKVRRGPCSGDLSPDGNDEAIPAAAKARSAATPMEEDGGGQDGVRPMAARLCDYMAPGGTRKYRPRPEWCRSVAPGVMEGARQDHSHHQCASSSASSSPPSRRTTRALFEFYAGRAAAAAERGEHLQPLPPDHHHHHHRHHHHNRIQQAVEADGEGDGDNDNDQVVVAAPQQPGPVPENALVPAGAYHNFMQAVGADEVEDDNASAGTEEAPTSNIDDDVSQATNSEALIIPGDAEARKPSPNAITPFHPSTFGKDFDFALHVAIREGATQAALDLLACGAPVDSENAKGVTPLILASQKGNLAVVQELLRLGASPNATTVTGTTAVLQAAHFGHVQVIHVLVQAAGVRSVELANYNHTTPLMRAAQEGHTLVVQYLLSRGALVNRRNRVQMTALMLASQRGHSGICRMLIESGADLDAMTDQHSTSLLLACKRAHMNVVRVLVTAGCELYVRDARGRTAREATERRELRDLTYLLDPLVQVHMMRQEAKRQRSWSLVRMWTLLQKERATIPWERHSVGGSGNATIHQLAPLLLGQRCGNLALPYHLSPTATQALVRTMALPSPLVEAIAQYAPIPSIWDKRIGLLTKQCLVNADAAILGGLDLVDEVMEEGGFLEACDMAQVPSPARFSSWGAWRTWCRDNATEVPVRPGERTTRPNATLASIQGPHDPARPSIAELRRQVGYLQLLSHYKLPVLGQLLTTPPFNVPPIMVQQLITINDIQSLARRMGSSGVNFQPPVAMDIIMLTSRLCSWFSREREEPRTLRDPNIGSLDAVVLGLLLYFLSNEGPIVLAS